MKSEAEIKALERGVVDPRKVGWDSPIAHFLDGYISERGLQSKARREAESLQMGTLGRFMATQDLHVKAVERGFRHMGIILDEAGLVIGQCDHNKDGRGYCRTEGCLNHGQD